MTAVPRLLILTYSYAGHTRQAARALQQLTGADWREIYPWQPYPMAFPVLLQQVKAEIRAGHRPGLLPGAPSPLGYASVCVGSPNWCGAIAPPMASWLSQYDWSGKVILPFYSHCGGVPCSMQREVETLCPGAQVAAALGVLDTEPPSSLPETFRTWLDACRIAL